MTVLVLHTFKEAPDPFPDLFIQAQEDWLLRTLSGCPTVKVSATRAQAYRNIECCTIGQRRCHLTACFLLSIIYNSDNAVDHYDLAWQHPIWCICIENAFDLNADVFLCFADKVKVYHWLSIRHCQGHWISNSSWRNIHETRHWFSVKAPDFPFACIYYFFPFQICMLSPRSLTRRPL